MNNGTGRLEAECRVFTTYLLGQAPDRYVTDKYLEAHRVCQGLSERSRFEKWLGAVARANRRLTRPADAYARIFAPRSPLRHKLVILLAILETSPPFYRSLEAVKQAPLAWQFLRLTGHGVSATLSLLVGTLLLLPAHVILRIVDRGGSR